MPYSNFTFQKGEKTDSQTRTDKIASRKASDATITPLSSPCFCIFFYSCKISIAWSLLLFFLFFSFFFFPLIFCFPAFQAQSYKRIHQENKMVRSIPQFSSWESSNVGLMWCKQVQCNGFGADPSTFPSFLPDTPVLKLVRSKHVPNFCFLKD